MFRILYTNVRDAVIRNNHPYPYWWELQIKLTYLTSNKGDKFLEKLWCYVGGRT